jgi:hypothetical protein
MPAARPPRPARVVVELDGDRHVLGVGDLIGRLPNAALVVDDPRVSEAHAIVSLRRAALHLLALRRLVAVDGRPRAEVRLRAGQRIELATAVAMTVLEVDTPAEVLGVIVPGRGPRPLPASGSFAVDPPRLIGRFVDEAAAHVWASGATWRVRVAGHRPRTIVAGDVVSLGSARFEIVALPLAEVAPAVTEGGAGAVDPLRLVARYDTVELHRPRREPVILGGLGARIISELVACAGPLSWQVLARDLWPDDPHDPDLRHRWDVALNRVRTRLTEAGIRRDLLHCDRSGQVSLVLHDGDDVEDRT